MTRLIYCNHVHLSTWILLASHIISKQTGIPVVWHELFISGEILAFIYNEWIWINMDLWYIGFRSICKNKYMVVKMVKLHTKVVLLCSQTFLSECCCTAGLWALCCLPSVFLKSRGVNSVNRNPYILRICSHHLHVTCTVSTAHVLNSICSFMLCIYILWEADIRIRCRWADVELPSGAELLCSL